MKIKPHHAWYTVGAILFAVGADLLLYAGYCAFTQFKFSLLDYDYVNYTNMIWNTAHGHGFDCMGSSYLSRHLSFTLALIAPVFWITQHGFALSFIQWMIIVGGVLVTVRAAAKHKLPAPLIVSIALFGIGYHFTQRAHLDEFHGVSLYLLLFPWIYYTCAHARRWAWLPLLLTLGLREDGGLMIFPIYLYFGLQYKWKTAYIYAAACLAYSALAIFALFPSISGVSLFDTRSEDLDLSAWRMDTLRVRLTALAHTLIPLALFFHRRGWRAVLAFIAVPFIVSMAGSHSKQYALELHYAAVVMAAMLIAAVEAARVQARETRRPRLPAMAAPAYLAVITALSWYFLGFLPGSYRDLWAYQMINGKGHAAARTAASHLPRGVPLITTRALSSFCAARRRLYTDENPDPSIPVDWFFGRTHRIPTAFRRALSTGAWGVHYVDELHCILERGGDTRKNSAVLEKAVEKSVLIADTNFHGGQDGLYRENGKQYCLRYWEGDGSRAPINLSYGGFISLPAGTYRAVFRFKSRAPKRHVRNCWGQFSIHYKDTPAHIAAEDIEPADTTGFREQAVDFEIPENAVIETRVTGGDAELWLERVKIIFLP